ncbi:hypothetical protein [Streptomyces sp. NPDC002589]|uniref:hypothetical protein n=1 Tax=unclassified Streptomyces TaxID=2593676 RepID=UPI00332DDE2E
MDGFTVWADVPSGRTSADMTVPTAEDGVDEPVASVRFQEVDPETGAPGSDGLVLSGSVRDAS